MIAHIEEALAEKQAKLDTLQAEMKAERIAMEEKVRADMSRQFQAEQRHHVEEMEGISREWEIERKVCCDQCALCVRNIDCIMCITLQCRILCAYWLSAV